MPPKRGKSKPNDENKNSDDDDDSSVEQSGKSQTCFGKLDLTLRLAFSLQVSGAAADGRLARSRQASLFGVL